MGKGVAILVVAVAFVFVMFIVMIYLMATLQPPKVRQTSIASAPSQGNVNSDSRKYDTMFYSFLPYMDRAQYGLEKAESDEIDFYHSTYKPPIHINSNFTGIFTFSPRNVVPPLWPRASRPLIISPTVHPSWHISPQYVLSTETKILNTGELAANKTTEKPMKRRSVGNFKKEKSGSIILKILDNVGHARIEIKLSTDNKNLTKNKSNGSTNNKSMLNIQPVKDEYDEVDYSEKAIVITPNESMILGESEGTLLSEKDLSEITNITHLLSSLLPASAMDKSKNNFDLEFEDNELEKNSKNINNPVVDRYYDIDKESFDNNTTILSSTHHSNNLTNHDITMDVQKNNTYPDNIMVDTKINNTEFNKVVFGYQDAKKAKTQVNYNSQVTEINKVGVKYTDSSNYTYIMSIENDGGVLVH